MKRLGKVSPQECVVIGDSPFDAEAAGKARIPSIGFLSGGFPQQDLEKGGYLAIYQGAGDLLNQYDMSIFTKQPGKS